MLAGMIVDLPRVYAEGGFVKVDVLSNGHVVERVAIPPNIALLLADALNEHAEMLLAQSGAQVIPLRAEG